MSKVSEQRNETKYLYIFYDKLIYTILKFLQSSNKII